ncbi:MAG: hypothetical protein LKF31_06880 [Muribaculaceae bacterium]|nr:hypothetical protein [Muribaculaceae bacterium]
MGQFSAFNILIIRVADGVSHKFFHQLCCIENWDNSVGQFGTMLMLDFQLFAIEIWALSRNFFTNYATHWWDNSVGQFGTRLMADFQLFAIEFSTLSQKFFTKCATLLVGQLGGTVWDKADG